MTFLKYLDAIFYHKQGMTVKLGTLLLVENVLTEKKINIFVKPLALSLCSESKRAQTINAQPTVQHIPKNLYVYY